MSKIGPLKITRCYCTPCQYLLGEDHDRNACSVFSWSCVHPEVGEKQIGETNRTPDWCPILKAEETECS
jgi:hypothetical protein